MTATFVFFMLLPVVFLGPNIENGLTLFTIFKLKNFIIPSLTILNTIIAIGFWIVFAKYLFFSEELKRDKVYLSIVIMGFIYVNLVLKPHSVNFFIAPSKENNDILKTRTLLGTSENAKDYIGISRAWCFNGSGVACKQIAIYLNKQEEKKEDSLDYCILAATMGEVDKNNCGIQQDVNISEISYIWFPEFNQEDN